MRRATAAAVGLASAAALGAGWLAGLTPSQPALHGSAEVVLAPVGPTTAASASATSPVKAAHTTTARPRSGSATGVLVDTQYGAVQVRVTFVGKRITDVRATHLTDSSDTSVSISGDAAPILRHEAMTAQSAQIDMVSGATYTSAAYKQSLQSAIDAAHLA